MMTGWKIAALAVSVTGLVISTNSTASAQTTFYGGSVVAPYIVSRPVYPVPAISAFPAPAISTGITTYRPYVSGVPVPPISYSASYSTYRPIVTVPPVAPVVATSVYRPAVIRPGVTGIPTVTIPGQPVRNAFRLMFP
jgi:hypothetical protein